MRLEKPHLRLLRRPLLIAAAVAPVFFSRILCRYVDGIKEGLPPIKLPKFLFRTGGCYSFFEAKLKPFLQYDDLKPEVFQIFREIGKQILP